MIWRSHFVRATIFAVILRNYVISPKATFSRISLGASPFSLRQT